MDERSTGRSFDESYTDYQVQRSVLRKVVRRIYLRAARSLLRGPTLDFGCGIGELLAGLPQGSIGLEYNHATVAYCRSRGMDVRWYDGNTDGWQLSPITETGLQSMVISHVLEHFEQPMTILAALLAAARRKGIERVLVIVPGRAGYRIDDTHLTFVDAAMLTEPSLAAGAGFEVAMHRYFPGNLRVLGDWVPHHELQVLFVRSA